MRLSVLVHDREHLPQDTSHASIVDSDGIVRLADLDSAVLDICRCGEVPGLSQLCRTRSSQATITESAPLI